ncbi:MAG TPA: ABC transporter ATP-binding protein [Vicinamibacterales bacterium]|jgi:ATP-binding cassette subfamily B protein|nr:ABC transporter ATP-binding protein [Vicinamibacterales bacterium]
MSRYRREFLLGFACLVISPALFAVVPRVLQFAIDDLSRGVTRAKLAEYSGLLLLIAAVGGYFRYQMRRIIISASRGFEYDLRNDFFAHLERLPLAYFQANRTGDLMSRATNDLSAVRMMVGPAVMYLANTVVTAVVSLSLMFALDPRLTLIALIPLPLVSIAVRLFGTAIHKTFEQVQERLAAMSAVVQESLTGVRVVRAYGQESAEIERFRASNEDYLSHNRRLTRLQGAFFPTMSMLLGVSALLALWLGSRRVVSGRITVGQFVAFNAYLAQLAWPMIAFGWVTNLMERGMASWKRMLEVMDTEPSVKDEPGALSPEPLALSLAPLTQSPTRGAIEFRDLTFAFGEQVVLSHVSFAIPAGETLAIVGGTGSGKTTLVNLLPRLHNPPRGTVFIDGRDVRDIPLAELRAAIGFVPQEPFLFSDTLADNIAFGVPALKVRRPLAISAAAEIAQLDKDVADFPNGYDTMVGERGITLSGGQKQRAAIARAVVIDPRILVLDDALSAVDTYTEEEILARLRGVMRERTSIIISHRISTVRDADQIIVLDNGRLVEHGKHQELIVRGGVYAELYKKQLLEEELAAS